MDLMSELISMQDKINLYKERTNHSLKRKLIAESTGEDFLKMLLKMNNEVGFLRGEITGARAFLRLSPHSLIVFRLYCKIPLAKV